MSSFGDLNRVNTNIQSLDSQLSLNRVNRDLADNQLRMSTGLRINRAEDDAAGFSIATKLNSRVAGLNQALQNVGDAKSVLDIAESSFDTIMDNLIEMKSLATQAANDTLGETERGYIAQQIADLGSDINEIAEQTVFQDLELLNGEGGDYEGALEMIFQVGERAEDTLTASIDAVNINELFEGTEAVGELDTGDGSFTGGDLGLGTTTGGTSASVTEFEVSDAGGTVAGATGLSIDTGEADDLQEVVDELNAFFEAEGLDENLSAELDENGDVAVSNANEEVEYTVEITGDFNADGDADDNEEVTLNEAEFNVNAEDQGEMDLDGWAAGDFRDFIGSIDTAIEAMSDRVNSVGIAQSSLSTREVTLSQSVSANESASSRIMDADFAKEQSESVRLQILQQTSTSALAQANMGPQSVLGFLG